ncbi:MAG TPA: hypothetical protein VGK67_16060 [Myxococcales bacterium]
MRGVAAAAASVALAVLPGSLARGEAQQRPILGVSTEERFDSAAAAGGESELMSKVSPELGYSLLDQNRTLEASYALDLIHHLRAGNLTFDHRARLDYKDRPGRRLRLFATGAFYRVEDMSSLPRFGVARVRAPALWVWGEAGAEGKLTRTLTLAGEYHAELSRIFLDDSPPGSTHAFSLQLRDQTGRRLVLGARVRGQLFMIRSSRYADAVAGTVSARYLPSRHTYVSLEGGPMVYRAQGQADALLPRLSAEVGYEGRGLLLGLSAGRDLVGAAGYAQAVWADYASAAATWRVTPAWSVIVGGGYYRNGPAPSAPANATGVNATAAVEWRFERGFVAAVAYDHLHQFGAAGAGLDLARDIVSFRLGYRTP